MGSYDGLGVAEEGSRWAWVRALTNAGALVPESAPPNYDNPHKITAIREVRELVAYHAGAVSGLVETKVLVESAMEKYREKVVAETARAAIREKLDTIPKSDILTYLREKGIL